jgi:hypothetical protein
MLIRTLQWFVTKLIAVLAISFLLISEFNALLVSVTILLLCIVFKTVCRNVVIARRSMYQGQSDMIIVNNAQFTRLDVSLAV